MRALVFVLLLIAGSARAEGAYEGLRLAPTLDVGVTLAHARLGVGADLSFHRWLWINAWASRVSHPDNHHWYPGAWTTGVAVNSRVAGERHAFVYGAGVVYTSAFYCPRGCTLATAITIEEDRSVFDMWAAQVRLGYQVYLTPAWFLRALFTVDLPFATRKVKYEEPGGVYDYEADDTPLTFLHGAGTLTVGYAFTLR